MATLAPALALPPMSFVVAIAVEFGDDEQPGALQYLRSTLPRDHDWTASHIDRSWTLTSPPYDERASNWRGHLKAVIEAAELQGLQESQDSSKGGVDVFIGLDTTIFSLDQLKQISALFLACQYYFDTQPITSRGRSSVDTPILSVLSRRGDRRAMFDTIFNAETHVLLGEIVNGIGALGTEGPDTDMVIMVDEDMADLSPPASESDGDSEADAGSAGPSYKVTLPSSQSRRTGMLRFIHHHSTLEYAVIRDWVLVLLRLVREADDMTKEEIIQIDEEKNLQFARDLGVKVD